MSNPEDSASMIAARRRFLAACGRFAVITPPAVTLMLSASRQNFAVAASGSGDLPGGGRWDHGHHHHRHHRDFVDRHADNGFGNGGHDGVPGRSGKEDRDR